MTPIVIVERLIKGTALTSQEHDDNVSNLKTACDELNIEKVAVSALGSTVATLEFGKVPASQLPAYVDDVLEFANLAGFPLAGESGKIYIAIDTNRSYRWSGSVYVDITGMVDSVAGKTGAVTLVKGDVGLGNVDNTSDANKPVSTAVQNALNLKQDSSTAVQKDSSTGAAYIPSGTTAQRPSSPSTGYMRFNTDLGKAEVWNGTVWSGVGGGATGGGADTVFVETSYTVTQDYTITAGKSAITVGDANGNVTVNDGVTISIPDNSSWVVQGS